MMATRQLYEFILDTDTGVFLHPDKAYIDYSDGSESYVEEVLRSVSDLSPGSEELNGKIRDWPSMYHFSSQRSNLLDAVIEPLSQCRTALEIGSGCGAITRWLAEHGMKVDAIEGSYARAKATRLRTRGQDSVTVYCGDASATRFSRQYDLVTMIGVLEYMALYRDDRETPESSCARALNNAADALSDSGILMIAIENQLGLKYFSGCREDHTNRLFDGIVGYPDRSPVTFSRQGLENMLRAAGFAQIQFYHLFPDYKLTDTVITEDEEVQKLRPYNWIKPPFDDYSGQRLHLMPEALALKTISDAGLLWQFSNSFLVLASKSGIKLKTPALIRKIHTFSSHRRCFYRRISLLRDTSGGYVVDRSPVDGAGSHIDMPDLEYRLRSMPFIEGEPLSYSIYRAVAGSDPMPRLKPVLQLLNDNLLKYQCAGNIDSDGYPMVSGAAIDYTPWNLIVTDDGSLALIDDKWQLKIPVPADFVLFRSLYHLYPSICPYIAVKDRQDFIVAAIRMIYPQYSMSRFLINLQSEERFQSSVSSRPVHLDGKYPAQMSVGEQVSRMNELEQKMPRLKELEDKMPRLKELEDKMVYLNELEQSLALAQDDLRSKDESIRTYKPMYDRFNRSLTLKLLNLYDCRVMPPGTRRRSASDLLLAGIRLSAAEGPVRAVRRGLVKTRPELSGKLGLSNASDYERWITSNEPGPDNIATYRSEAALFNYRPLLSIVTPVYNPDPAWIQAAIESVSGQAYDNWELCIADASTNPAVTRRIEEYAGKDPRIKLRVLDNKGIAGNSNEALSMATGEFICLLDHDDELSPDALYHIVSLLQSRRDADMIYSDEDKIDLGGRRSDPFFKPDWSPDMFLSCMYSCHLGVYRKSIIDAIGGFREGYDGSQDYDLVLRFIERTDRICHIPRVLYHWRTTPGSTATSTDKKTYAQDAAKKALSDYLGRNGIRGEVLDGIWPTSYRVKRTIAGNPLVSIIIPTKDHAGVLKRCVDSILDKTTYDNFEILVIDNGSVEKDTRYYFDLIRRNPKINIVPYPEPFNFSAINNFGTGHAKGDYLLFLNNDTEVISGEWLASMLEHAQRKEVGAVGCKLLYPDNRIQHAGVILGINGGTGESVAGHSHKYMRGHDYGYMGRVTIVHNASAVTAACLMTRKNVFEEIGGFDEGLAIAFNDIDLCLKIREKGYLIVYTPYAELYHHESLSRGYEDSPEKQRRFAGEIAYVRQRWGRIIDAGDPYYSPNLSLRHEDFRIKN